PDISDLDFQNAVAINGFFIPALKESKIQTDVVTPPGESIIMGGLLRRVEERTMLKIPLLGDLPVFGQLFRSTRYQNTDTDVVFVMTPEIVTR
ncbi:MAG: type II and III secretion system protein family protein, partial [Candidatus Eremiobacteraeota bacterium]|nr:type II and III secretion system protein family protein [Candidatus Eremiobacteraeota bacterium]